MLWQGNTTYLSVIQECSMLQPQGFCISIPYQVSQHLSDICSSPAPPHLLLSPFDVGNHCTTLGTIVAMDWALLSPSLSAIPAPHRVGPLQNPLQLLDVLASPSLQVCSCCCSFLRSLTVGILPGLAFSSPPSIPGGGGVGGVYF